MHAQELGQITVRQMRPVPGGDPHVLRPYDAVDEPHGEFQTTLVAQQARETHGGTIGGTVGGKSHPTPCQGNRVVRQLFARPRCHGPLLQD